MTRDLSVVVPTRDRAETLALVLGSLARETADLPVEVVVVDDGSRDRTPSVLELFRDRLPLRIVRGEARGPAAARNRGIAAAAGRAILFIDDDIIVEPGLVEGHLRFHREHADDETGLLGLVQWDPAVRPTPFMDWLERGGRQFEYEALEPGEPAGYRHFYTCNLSVKRALLQRVGGFDEEFTRPLYEDIELGYRLEQAGLRLIYAPTLRGLHHRRLTFGQMVARERRLPEAERLLARKPVGAELDIRPSEPMPLGRRLERAIIRAVYLPLRWLADSRLPLPDRLYARMLNLYGRG